jgi:hypothetical protein
MLLEAMCLAIAMHGEARGESIVGQVAVAEVVLERVRDPRWPDTVCGVVFQPKQFTGVTKRLVERQRWTNLLPLAEGVLATPRKSGGPNHFYSHKRMSPPWWSSEMDVVGVIGGHTFLRDGGEKASVEPPSDPFDGGTYASADGMGAGTTGIHPTSAQGMVGQVSQTFVETNTPLLHGPAEVG